MSMNWTREDLKTRGKGAFKRNYWKCVLVALILALIAGGSSSARGNDYFDHSNFEDSFTSSYDDFQSFGSSIGKSVTDNEVYSAVSSLIHGTISVTIAFFVLLGVVLGSLISILVFAPLQVGGCRFFTVNSWDEHASAGLILSGFKNHYGNVVLTMFLRSLFTGLWSLLFIIPGIVKSYEYRMIPYLLADNPDMNWQDAFQESKRMMDGQKWDAFVLDLSFIGWDILSGITGGIVGIFYSNPYQYATNAELYLTLRDGSNPYMQGTTY